MPLHTTTTSPESFNPRTREECDMKRINLLHDATCFNPRTREECDCCLLTSSKRSRSFNPRTREECDQIAYLKYDKDVQFQSTHP